MSSKTRHAISRRTALVGFAVTAVSDSVGGQTVADTKTIETSAGPVFSLSGPNAELYGATDGFPIPSRFLARLQGNPFEPKYRVSGSAISMNSFPRGASSEPLPLGPSSVRRQTFATVTEATRPRWRIICHAILSLDCSFPRTTGSCSSTTNMGEPIVIG